MQSSNKLHAQLCTWHPPAATRSVLDAPQAQQHQQPAAATLLLLAPPAASAAAPTDQTHAVAAAGGCSGCPAHSTGAAYM